MQILKSKHSREVLEPVMNHSWVRKGFELYNGEICQACISSAVLSIFGRIRQAITAKNMLAVGSKLRSFYLLACDSVRDRKPRVPSRLYKDLYIADSDLGPAARNYVHWSHLENPHCESDRGSISNIYRTIDQ